MNTLTQERTARYAAEAREWLQRVDELTQAADDADMGSIAQIGNLIAAIGTLSAVAENITVRLEALESKP